MPRPSKLTPAVKAALVEAVEGGNYIETAVRACGIGTSTYYRWMEQGEADLENGKASAHRELWEAIKTAEAEAETNALSQIRAAARENWQAAAWYLERKFPDRWGRRERHEATSRDDRVRQDRVDAAVAELEAMLTGSNGNGHR